MSTTSKVRRKETTNSRGLLWHLRLAPVCPELPNVAPCMWPGHVQDAAVAAP